MSKLKFYEIIALVCSWYNLASVLSGWKLCIKGRKEKDPKERHYLAIKHCPHRTHKLRATLDKCAVFSLRLMKLFKHMILLIRTASWCKKQEDAPGPSASNLTLWGSVASVGLLSVCLFLVRGSENNPWEILRGRTHPEVEKAEKGYKQSHYSWCRGLHSSEKRAQEQRGRRGRGASFFYGFYLPCSPGWSPRPEESAAAPWQLWPPLLHRTCQAPGPLPEGRSLPERQGQPDWTL